LAGAWLDRPVSCTVARWMRHLMQRSDTNEESEDHSQSDSGVQLQLFGPPDLTDTSGCRDIRSPVLEGAEAGENHHALSIDSSGTESAICSQPIIQFQLSLSADQLARLWLREPNLNPSNVYAWSRKKGQWVAALSVPEVADHIARARIESVKMWSVLCASRISATMPPPPQHSRQLSGRIAPGNQLSSPPRSRILSQSLDIAQQRTEELGPQLKSFPLLSRSRSVHLRNSIQRLVVEAGFQIDFYRTRARRLLRRHAFRMASRAGVSLAAIAALVVVAWLSNKGNRTQKILEPWIAESPGRSQSNLNTSSLFPMFIDAQSNSTKVGDVMTAIDPPLNPATPPTRIDLPKKTTPASVMPHFDAGIAERAIDKSTARAQDCTDGDIYGKLVVTFYSSGYVQNVDFVQFSGDGNQRNCVADLVGKLRISPFTGGPVMVRKNIHVHGAQSG